MSELIFNGGDGGDGQEPPKIEFPCRYPIKIVGDAGADFQTKVTDTIRKHAPGFTDADVSMRASSKGRFSSVTVFITATGKEQLQAIFNDLKAINAVKMVL